MFQILVPRWFGKLSMLWLDLSWFELIWRQHLHNRPIWSPGVNEGGTAHLTGEERRLREAQHLPNAWVFVRKAGSRLGVGGAGPLVLALPFSIGLNYTSVSSTHGRCRKLPWCKVCGCQCLRDFSLGIIQGAFVFLKKPKRFNSVKPL